MNQWNNLTEEDAKQNRSEVVTQLLDAIKQVKATDSGYTLRFGSSGHDLGLAMEWIQIERVCNPFLRFKLSVESNGGPVSLEMVGPAGTQEFLRSELALNRWM